MGGFTGGCLCGKVRYQSSEDPKMAGHCHCEMCRKLSGTGHSSHLAVPAAAVTFNGPVASYSQKADSGFTTTRYFCPNCGSPVYGTSSRNDVMLFIRASSLDDPEIFQPSIRTYASSTASWDHMDPDLTSFDKLPQG